MTPFIFKEKEYRLINCKNKVAYKCYPKALPSVGIHDDHFVIRNITDDRIMSAPLYNCYFASAFIYNDRCYCFAIDYEFDRPWWTSRRLLMLSSDDLITWTKPQIVLEAEDTESLFNTDVVFDGEKFVMLYENDDPKYNPKFTFKFAISNDLVHWEKVPNAVYGRDKYVGGPTMEFFDGYYYVTYVNYFKNPKDGKDNYDTRITRSRDLITWEDAPEGKSVLMPSYEYPSAEKPHLEETNASDAEFLEKNSKVYCYYNGGNQENLGGAYVAEYTGTLKQLFSSFFDNK
jgi:alpha-L-fucosidase